MIVTLAETTPVLEAASLREDLRRAGIEPCAWVINNSLTISDTQSSLLKLRAEHELARIDAICTQYAKRIALTDTRWKSHSGRVLAGTCSTTQRRILFRNRN